MKDYSITNICCSPFIYSPLDKSAGGKFLKEFNENCAKLQDYCDSLAGEVDARKDIIHLLTDAYTSCTASISQLVQTIKVTPDTFNHSKDTNNIVLK